MKRSLPLAQLSVFGRQFSVPGKSGSTSATSHTSPATRHSTAFTLIELMVVIAIVAVLAALTLGMLGYVNRKGAAARAQTEVAAISAAIDSYRAEQGAYPASNNLYTELTAGGPVNTSKVYFEPPPNMVQNGRLTDPYGQPYNYSTEPERNIGSFDLWSVPPGEDNKEENWIHN